MIYTLAPKQVGPYTLHFEDLDGDTDKVQLVKDHPQYGRGGIMKTHYFRSGKHLKTDHLPTKISPKARKGKLPDYAIHGMAQVCSQAFRDIVEAHDPGIHQLEPAQIVWKDGTVEPEPYYWLIPGARLWSVDPDESNPALTELGHFVGFGSKAVPRPGPVQPVFRKEYVGDHDLFCDDAIAGGMFISERLKNALIAAEMIGVGFPNAWPLI